MSRDTIAPWVLPVVCIICGSVSFPNEPSAQGLPGPDTLVREHTLSLGAGVTKADPGYVGYHDVTAPFPIIAYRRGDFFLAGGSAGYVVAQGGALAFTAVLRPRFMHVNASDSTQLSGIQARRWSVDGGFGLSIRHDWGVVSFEAFHDVLSRNNGGETRALYTYSIPLGLGRLTPGFGLSWKSANLADYYYGVRQSEARGGRPVYTPGSALDSTLRLDYSRPVAKGWMVSAGFGRTRFSSAIRNSPLVDHWMTSAFTLSVFRIFNTPHGGFDPVSSRDRVEGDQVGPR